MLSVCETMWRCTENQNDSDVIALRHPHQSSVDTVSYVVQQKTWQGDSLRMLTKLTDCLIDHRELKTTNQQKNTKMLFTQVIEI